MTMYTVRFPSPAGALNLLSDGRAVTRLWFDGQKYAPAATEGAAAPELPVFQAAKAWLDAYFLKLPLPALPPLAPEGSPFRQAVWSLLREIPYGQTTTYGALSRALQGQGVAASPQAVGGAVGHNPISILIPCHRVVGAGGALTGYAAGVDIKAYLLRLEQAGT